MKATESKLLEFLKKSPQFIIPIYQRTYAWNISHCQQLWDDILRAGKNTEISAHFIGSVVYIEQSLYQVSSQSPLLVIDGQQRLTTVTLLIEALSRHLSENEPIEGFSAKKLRHYYLLNTLEEHDRQYKLLLSKTDRASLKALLNQKDWPDDVSLRIKENFEFFDNKIQGLGDNLAPLCKGITKLLIVDVALSRGQDNPQLIFESMNSTGKALTQADLIRNFILMGLEPAEQTRLYEVHWRPMETTFGQNGYSAHFDHFIRHYLTVKMGNLPRINDVYEDFKQYANSPKVAQNGVEALVSDIHTFAKYYCAMALDKEKNEDLKSVFHDLRILKVEVAYPLLLELYDDYAKGLLDIKDFIKIIKLIEAYIFRRAVCAIPTNSTNKTFATFSKMINKEHYLDSVAARFLNLPSYRRFPDDTEFKMNIKIRDLYHFRSRRYWLRKIENFERKEPIMLNEDKCEYTIEHILPQNPKLSAEWQLALGSDWQSIQETWLHTLGNLTLTGYNAEYSDKYFLEKRDMEGGFKYSPLKLNEDLGKLDTWNEDTIKQRAEKLAEKALKVWQSPKLAPEILELYNQESRKVTGYSLTDHPFLIENTITQTLFDHLREKILALHEDVSQDILKLYIAFKFKTNFVDIIPKKNGLKLSLNIPFNEVDDPLCLTRDVSQIGRWGNGETEIEFNNLEQLSYIFTLIEQAFQRQIEIR